MSCWQTLGVEPGSDQRIIKRAYARLLKNVHPEEHPEDFMALREAYELALAKGPKASPRRVFDTDLGRPESEWLSQPNSESTPESLPMPEQALNPEPGVSLESQAKHVAEREAARQVLADGRTRIQQEHWQREQALREERGRAQQHLNELVDYGLRLLNDPERCADSASWEAFLLQPELHSLEVRLAVGRGLLVGLMGKLSDRASAPIPAEILVRLDECFQWGADQSLQWSLEDESIERLSLLLAAARESLAAPPRKICWRWLGQTMFNLKGRITRGEYLLGMAAVLGIAASVLRLTDALLPSGLQDKVWLVALLLLVYSFLISYMKRLGDSGTNILVALLVGIALPFAFFVFAMLGRERELNANNPQSKFVDLYEVALAELFRGGGTLSMATHARNFIRCIHPNLAYVVICSWGLNVYSMMS
ncbi:MAG: J domain-containing protein [Pseudomonadales bacterium]